MTDQLQQPQQPDTRPETRVWLISSAFGFLGYAVAQEALKLGDYVVAGCKREEIELERRTSTAQNDGSREDSEDESRSIQYLKRIGGDSCIIVELDTRNVSLCQSALAEAINVWGRIDVILNCDSKTYAGTLEELNPTHILDQFESNFFGPINMMKSALPFLRKQRGGHIVNVTGLTGHMGTPGLSALVFIGSNVDNRRWRMRLRPPRVFNTPLRSDMPSDRAVDTYEVVFELRGHLGRNSGAVKMVFLLYIFGAA